MGAPSELDALIATFGGRIDFPAPPSRRPYVFANFVSTLDGVISFALPGQSGGGAISGGDSADRFLMGLLRASCDAVIVGAGTLLPVPPEVTWRPETTYPPAQAYFASMQPRPPLLVVVSGSGRLDLERAVFRTPELPTVIFTSPDGMQRLTAAGAGSLPSVALRALDSSPRGLEVAPMLAVLYNEFAVRRLLCEGGPSLLADFLRADLLDELFLTLAPRLAGRAPNAPRPGLIEGLALSPETSPLWHRVDTRVRGDFLYLRYRR